MSKFLILHVGTTDVLYISGNCKHHFEPCGLALMLQLYFWSWFYYNAPYNVYIFDQIHDWLIVGAEFLYMPDAIYHIQLTATKHHWHLNRKKKQ